MALRWRNRPPEAIAEAVANYKIPENMTSTPKPIPKPKLVKRQNYNN
ncbi:hypothetical protein LC653_41095 [Nostoc sp. CHAB 5784]|nr:hypothetical protein [Nostoc mirabile]MCC5670027.1 hypothetical protein [Nostoc mirabile CHAB5784]